MSFLKSLGWEVVKDADSLREWDEIQRTNPQGMFTQTTSWLSSYASYGFDYEVLVKKSEEGKLEAGMACLLVKAGPFKIYSCPWGPYTSKGINSKECLEVFSDQAKKHGAMVAQFNPAWSDQEDSINNSLKMAGFEKGAVLKKVFVPVDFNLIELPNPTIEDWEKVLLKSFSENARRNIKTGLKNEVDIQRVTSFSELEMAYRCFEANAEREGYTIRFWEDVKDSLWDGVQKGNYLISLARFEGKVVGAIWCAHGGNTLSYIMGGVDRTEKDLKLGHLLQWSSICEAVQLGYSHYNISVGGSEGVVRFKSSFYPTQTSSPGPYFKVLKKVPYQAFNTLFPLVEKNKKLASKLLKLLK